MLTVYTIGHSARTTDEFVGPLNDYGVTRSRHNPQFGHDVLQEVLQATSIRYLYLAALGGLRRGASSDVTAGRRNASFRAYANHMRTPEFDAGIDELVDLAGEAVP
ncbi:DUF488 family protein [Nocardia salmonicida]|uniref:DUF488 domain-containing protein n=1 Tax=Nocardia salmonicida TaxID=53431 RepID=UPI003654156D